jgi:outer membrane murein-binding lipoprotein Lpp
MLRFTGPFSPWLETITVIVALVPAATLAVSGSVERLKADSEDVDGLDARAGIASIDSDIRKVREMQMAIKEAGRKD